MMATLGSQSDMRFVSDAVLQQFLPVDLRELVLKSNGVDFLEAVSKAALVSGCVERVFLYYEYLTPEIAARWTNSIPEVSSTLSDDVNVVACLAKIFPFARYLRPMVKEYLSMERFSISRMQNISNDDLEALLLGIFRLLSTEPVDISETIKPTFLSRFFNHGSLVVRRLAISCMCIVMRFADALEVKLMDAYVGRDPVFGTWEGKVVDFRLLKLLEEKRWMNLESEVDTARFATNEPSISQHSRFGLCDLSTTTACVGGVLVPRSNISQIPVTTFVETPTAVKNLGFIGQSILQQKPILITGHSGSGKTTLIREAARLLNKLSSIITLHLNEQTDAKSLLGIYTSSESGESFTWQPGVLTKAVQQGRWVLIEDIDRTPSEVLGVLRPLIENGEIFLPSRKEKIRPKEGFRIFATIKSSGQERGTSSRHSWLTNTRLWSTANILPYSMDEVRDLLRQRYQHIEPLLADMLHAHEFVCEAYQSHPSFRAVQSRIPSLRDLLKWCQRTNRRIQDCHLDLNGSGMPEVTKTDIFKDGIDCYAAYHSDFEVFRAISQLIAQALNISPQQIDHILSSAASNIRETSSEVVIGRSVLTRIQTRKSATSRSSLFALTNQAKRIMESIASGTSNWEPLLLVGETGVGKTTQVQHIANLVNQKLTVVNLSQQSEAADLLGGLKPITTRSLLIPLVDQFSVLFDDTFSNKRNEKFRMAISKAIMKENWQRLVLLWQEAVQMAENSLNKPFETAEPDAQGQSAKRRKLASKYGPLRDRWTVFSSKLNTVRAQVERGDKNHAFAFVEGRLVQAVRNGEWLLLDEINLASADTLDHIMGLLTNSADEQPSLLLAEAGSIEQIVAHKDFRIFAAMNPATDTGKKDLAPGVRSRFTELYVQAGDDNSDDLIKIVQTYLGVALSSDKRAAHDLAKAYLQLKRLGEEHKLTDGAGDAPHFSIRSLVRCLLYMIQHGPSHGLRRSMYEGFAMSFFTVLSIESERLALSMITSHLLSSIRNIPSFLAQQPKLPVDETLFVAFRHHLVRRGANSPDSQPQYIRTPSVERNLINLARATSMCRFPVLLQGPTSAGKTSTVEYLAKFTGNEFVRINNHEHTDLQEYLGSYATGDDGKLEFREGVLVEALRKGHWIVLDELNLAPSDVLEALNRLLDDNRELLIPESQEIIRPHPNFMLFATQNPAGLYGGRKRLSRAFRNRFLELHFDDIPEDELEVILRKRAQIAPSYCTQIVQVYKKLSLQRQSTRLFESKNSFATLRDLFRWAARPADDRQQLARHGFMLLAERVRDPLERKLVKTTIEETMKVKINEHELYGMDAIPTSLQSSSHIVWTLAMRRLFVLVSEALKNDEPVLLVGETGCGKTQICQTVSQAFSRNLSIYNAHSNTETGDLIGSQRPIRQRSELATALLDKFGKLNTSHNGNEDIEARDLEDLIASFDKIDTSAIEASTVQDLRQSIAAYQSLFTWSDGSLVRSMKSGEHFLLDEISLADDSVLERLNSVLEPSRSILLAEKGSIDNFVAAKSGFQFLATMNPGGDFGKRELSAALRNRLTEIWVPPLSQEEDILPILRAKLLQHAELFSKPMLEFATWFRDNVQTSAASTIPLRNLLAWADFMHRLPGMDPTVAFIHGAAMVYIDSLGANPAGLANTIGQDIQATRKICLQKLQQLILVSVDAVYNAIPQITLSPTVIRVGSFALPRNLIEEKPSDLFFDAPTTLRNTMRIVRALQMNRPILLEGSPGVGKTAIVTALAAIVGKELTRINLSDQTDLMDLFGADAPSENEMLGRFSWRDGPLLRAMQTGGWVLLDEMNLASQSVLEGLNSCLDHRHEVYIAELDKSFSCHPEFTLFAAQNPHHQGGGRKGLPASFVNRFTVVYADPFEREDLMLICQHSRSEVAEESLSRIVDTVSAGHDLVTHSAAFSAGGPWELNLRDVNRWLDLVQGYRSLPPSHHFETLITQRFRSQGAVSTLNQLREEHFDKPYEPSLFHNLSPRVFQLRAALMERNQEFQPALMCGLLPTIHLPYAASVITALNHHWPVILAGRSGCGKSFLIRNLAGLCGAKLVEFSMNSDIDTMDLIGGFEQYDTRRDVLTVQKSILAILMAMVCSAISEPENLELVNVLLAAHEQCSIAEIKLQTFTGLVGNLAHRFEEFRKPHQDLLDIATKSIASRFTWNDGILIDALQEGSWLVLDNANLCNPSVLDRLNSLLEPNGVLAISEQHSGSDGERIVRPHRNFRIFLTMDPAYGELSRAMRNRSLELFMDDDLKSEKQSTTPIYASSAGEYRMRHVLLQPHVPNSIQPVHAWQALRAGLLSAKDSEIIAPQMQNFLDEQIEINSLQSSNELYKLVTSTMQPMWPKLLSNKNNLKMKNQLQQILWHDQPQMFILNDALVHLLEEEPFFPSFALRSRQYLVELQRAQLEQELIAYHETTSQLDREDMNVLQKSILNQRLLKQKGVPVPDAYRFLASIINHPLVKIEALHTSEQAITRLLWVVSFARDMLQLFSQRMLNLDVLNAYIQIAHRFMQKLPSFEMGLRECLETALSGFNAQFVLQSGQSLQRMWLRWKPTTAMTLKQVEAQMVMESLLARFNAVAKHLSHRQTELAEIRFRLNSAFNLIPDDSEPMATADTFSQAIQNLEEQHRTSKLPVTHFASTFQSLVRSFVIQGKNLGELEFQNLLLFVTSVPVALDHKQSSVANTLYRLAYLNNSYSPENARPDLIPSLATLQSEPLSSLSYLHAELKQVVNTMSGHTSEILVDNVPMLRNCVYELLTGILRCHDDLLTVEARNCLVQDDDDDFDFVKLAQLGIHGLDATQISQVGYYKDIYSVYLLPVISVLARKKLVSSESTGACLTRICVAALKLLVPDKTYDPATYPTLVASRHQTRTTELQEQIGSFKHFQLRYTGQESSTIISILEKDLVDLGEPPLAPIIVRPLKSELHLVQQEFSMVLRNVVDASPLRSVLECIDQDSCMPKELIRDCEMVQTSITRVVDRLSRLNRTYDDIVKPVAWLLESLSLGTRLVSVQSKNNRARSQEILAHSVPLLGGTPQLITARLPQAIIAAKRSNMWWARHLQIRSQMIFKSRQSINDVTIDFLHLVDKFYVEWKTRLTKDQAETEAKSRYYAYRGEDDSAQEVDESELMSLFPTYDGHVELDSTSRQTQYDVRDISIKLADLHGKLYENQHPSNLLHDYVVRMLGFFGNGKSEVQGVPLGDLLPGIFLKMQNSLTELEKVETNPEVNIYSDSDVAESRKLIDLVERIKVRFREISEQWPEHAVPAEVLSYSDELLAFRIDEPIAKLLTKTEKLFEIVNQWQSVASREWSVMNLMEALTDLLIHWRRLELLSWSRLLENERKRNEEDAKAWYFIAYEAVLYNSRMVVEQTNDLTPYCQELARTLEDFLRTTTLGQFSCRLNLLKGFLHTLDVLAQEDKRLERIVQCVSGVLYHYHRYEPDITQTLLAGRTQLEKDITEQIKLASWKDTNIQSLKDSARRSHYKLFKIVKKYRSLLSQPLTSFKVLGLDVNVAYDPALTLAEPQSGESLDLAFQQCATEISGWSTRPDRLTNPLSAATSMRKLYTVRDNDFIAYEEIAAYHHDIASTALELRKQTPQVSTEDNGSLVRHLRERKRRLFAETMRRVTQMGVRRNLATAELSKQTSLAEVLTFSRDTPTIIDTKIAQAANGAFHEVLDNMAGVRKAAIEHSEDLTDGETRRAIGLLEGLLAVQIAQRADLSHAADSLQSFRSVLQLVINLGQDFTRHVKHVSRDEQSKQQWIETCVVWLPAILDVSCDILAFQSRQGGFNVDDLIQTLREESHQLETARIDLYSVPNLPSGLSTTKHAGFLEGVWSRLYQLGDVLSQWQEKEPNVGYLLQQLHPWTQPFDTSTSYSNGFVISNVNAIDVALRQILDSVFVAMQNIESTLSNQPNSTEDQGWLIKSSQSYSESIKRLHLSNLAEQLSSALLQLRSVAADQLELGLALVNVAAPVLEQYILIAERMYRMQLYTHYETCRLGVHLAKSFVSLANEGFCTPHEPAKGDEQQSGKLESGTGLGEGEGTEDISKDIGENEDLSELAQAEAEKQQDGEEMSKEKDAVDMGADDLEGDIGSGDEKGSDEEENAQSGSENEDDMDEEAGSVDDLDPSAVDEKLWDDMRANTEKEEKEMKSDKQKGQKSDEQTAKENDKREEEDEMEGTEEVEGGEEEDDEDDTQGRPEAENLDPHLQEEEALDMPEEMQLNGEEEGKEDDISDDGMEETSDIDNMEQPMPEQVDEVEDKDAEDRENGDIDKNEDEIEEDENAEGKAQDDEVIEDQAADEDEEKPENLDTRYDEMQYDVDDNEGGDTGAAKQRDENTETNDDVNDSGKNEKDEVVNEQQTQTGKASDEQKSGDTGKGALEQGVGKEDQPRQNQDDALKKLADVLEQYHQRREIVTASEDRQRRELDQDVDMADADFEHLGDNDQDADAQALGAASADQVQKLDQSKAIEHQDGDADQELPIPEELEMAEEEHQETIAERFSRLQSQPHQPKTDSGALIPDTKPNMRAERSAQDEGVLDIEMEDEEQIDINQLHQDTNIPPPTSDTDAVALWSHCSTQTHTLSLLLTEQLRLILAPTTATKLRGDFRTGKRLNIKRIIPYIASGYKRDKIWMRRSIPSKRNYQIMIAVDDSKSMSESGADLLAFETLAMLSKSLSMLEAGDLCIVSFGDADHIRIAHPFGQPFTSDSGPTVFRTFGFQQRGTDVRKLLRQSQILFQDARLHSSNDDLWQLQLIVSDGHCSDHDSIRQLVRAAHANRIMIVFVIVDAGQDSIVDLKTAVFEPVDPAVLGGEMTVRTKRYLEGFPFGYYVVVREVGDLPGVLARVLRGWFEGVVNG